MYKKLIVFVVFSMIVFTGCEKNEEAEGDPSSPKTEVSEKFKVKKGTVTYRKTKWTAGNTKVDEIKLIFDEYGKKFREEFEGGSALIVNGETRKAYTLLTNTKTYIEQTNFDTYAGLLSQFIYLGDDPDSSWKLYPGFTKKPSRNIAGKQCSMVSWVLNGKTVERGGWENILFWDQYYTGSPGTDDSVRFEAVSFSETIPDNCFVVPSDYTKM